MGKPVDFLDWIEEHIQPNTIHTLVNRSWCKFRRVSLATKERIHANAMYTYRCNFWSSIFVSLGVFLYKAPGSG